MENSNNFIAGYRILTNQKAIVEIRTGYADFEMFVKYHAIREETDEYNTDFDLILDLSEMYFDFALSDMDVYANKYEERQSKISETTRTAIVARTLNQVSHSHEMFKRFTKSDSEIFSRLDLALEWLDKQREKKEVISAIDDIKKNPDYCVERKSNEIVK